MTTDSENINYLKTISTVRGFQSLIDHQKEKIFLSIGNETMISFGILRIHLNVIDGLFTRIPSYSFLILYRGCTYCEYT